jgi:hypothetical protein
MTSPPTTPPPPKVLYNNFQYPKSLTEETEITIFSEKLQNVYNCKFQRTEEIHGVLLKRLM